MSGASFTMSERAMRRRTVLGLVAALALSSDVRFREGFDRFGEEPRRLLGRRGDRAFARAGARSRGARHRTQTASTSEISFGTASVRFRWPSSVTSTSSSIRIPTPRISAGAASSSAGT